MPAVAIATAAAAVNAAAVNAAAIAAIAALAAAELRWWRWLGLGFAGLATAAATGRPYS